MSVVTPVTGGTQEVMVAQERVSSSRGGYVHRLHFRISRSARRAGLAVTTLAIVVGAIGSTALPASAAKKPVIPSQSQVDGANAAAQAKAQQIGQTEAQLAAANASLDKLNNQVEAVVEAYDGAMAKVDAAQQNLAAAQSNLAAANKARADAQIQMNQFAAASYRGAGGLDRLSALMTSDSPGAFLTRASTLSALARHEQSVISLMTSTQTAQASAQDAANAALADQQVELQAAAKAKDAAIAAVNAQAGQIATINGNQLNLNAQLAVLRGTAKDLATARAEGLKLQAEEAAAAAAAAKAAAARAAAARAAAAAAALAAQKRAAALAQQQAAAAAARQSSGGGADTVSSSGGGSSGGGGGGGYTNNGGGVVPPGGQSISTSAQRQAAIAFAESQIGVWYRWAGAGEVGPTVTSTGVQKVPGYDCSGLTMQAYAAAGISLAHYTGAQWDEGLHVSQAQLQPGDLVFFATNTNDPSTIHHVGIYIGNGQMVDAPATGEQIGIHNAFRPDYIGAVQL
jgi:cell wall-associated NlpC family hydrolase